MNRAVQLPEPFIYLRKTSFGHSKPKHTEELPVGTNYPQGIWFANFVNYQNTHVKVSWLDSFLKWEDQSTNQPKAASKLRMQWVPILQFHVHLAVLVQDEQPCGLPAVSPSGHEQSSLVLFVFSWPLNTVTLNRVGPLILEYLFTNKKHYRTTWSMGLEEPQVYGHHRNQELIFNCEGGWGAEPLCCSRVNCTSICCNEIYL